MDLEKILLPIIKDAAKIMLSAHDIEASSGVATKLGDANFVTVYDKATENFLIEKIKAAIPDARFVAEESENDYSVLSGEHVFVIDPIDGTTNFIHGFSHSSISVACVSRGKVVFGAVYNPYLDEMFYASLGCGAFKNGKTISVSERGLGEALILFGSSPYYKDELKQKSFTLAYKLFEQCADLRRLASAAIDLCYIAEGRAEIFFEYRLSPWDYCAGSLILTEAGGRILDMDGAPLDMTRPCSVIAANEKCFEGLRKTVNGLK